MSEKTSSRTVDLSDIVARLERLEAKVGSCGGSSPPGSGAGGERKRFCSLPAVPPRVLAPDVSMDRARLIQTFGKKWVNGTKLRYYFFTSGPYAGNSAQCAIVREGFDVWKNVGLGVTFSEVTALSEAEVRIGFLEGDGAWSYIGRDIIDVAGQNERTMNFGWDLNRDPRRENVAVHEIGHTLGFPHEHQNPFAGIVWDENAVYEYFGGPPNNWDRQTTLFNVLKKLSPGEVRGSQWDPNSIMHYAFDAGLILQPERYRTGLNPAGGISERDLEQARFFYPPIQEATYVPLKPFHSESLALAPGEQKNFEIKPTATRTYSIQTFGKSDTVMVLFEDQSGDLIYVKGDDDSGTDLNARIDVKLFQGRRYVLRLRLYSNYATGESAVMLW